MQSEKEQLEIVREIFSREFSRVNNSNKRESQIGFECGVRRESGGNDQFIPCL